MRRKIHEVRDAIHVFIRLDTAERRVLNSWPVQRLRHIHQLALTNLVYPGATHRRFEHSLGVMELATRIYDTVVAPGTTHEKVRSLVPEYGSREYHYWRLVVRMAALCHDIGHLPFSHAAERELLPPAWRHEDLTRELLRSEHMRGLWHDLKVDAEDIAKIAVGPKYYRDAPFSDLDAILYEVIGGDVFGADRIDYLLRDSHHAGVAYGRFDHYRLIDTIRILPKEHEHTEEPALGIEEGGLQSAESLLWARYLMYTQLYFHSVRRIYDIHLKEFLKAVLPDGRYPIDLPSHLEWTDNEVSSALLKAAHEPDSPGHDPARRVVQRDHFRVVYTRNPEDQSKNLDAVRLVYEGLQKTFGPGAVRRDTYSAETSGHDFPVRVKDGRITSSLNLSETLGHVPTFSVDYVYIDPELRDKAERWLNENRDALIPAVNAGGEKR
jgi:HD superfamily phosphohydrolase